MDSTALSDEPLPGVSDAAATEVYRRMASQDPLMQGLKRFTEGLKGLGEAARGAEAAMNRYLVFHPHWFAYVRPVALKPAHMRGRHRGWR